jgi:hypothetical protein
MYTYEFLARLTSELRELREEIRDSGRRIEALKEAVLALIERYPQVALSILLDPEALHRIIMASGLHADARLPTARAAWLCPAGQTTEVTFYLPKGWNCASTFVTISADYYSPGIIVYVYADDNPVTPWGVVLMSETKVSYGEYFIKRKSVRFKTVNSTDVDVHVSGLCYGVMLSDRLLESFYIPLLNYARDVLLETAKRLRPVPLPAGD